MILCFSKDKLSIDSTLGFGDITFHSDLGRLFSVLVLFSGIVVLLVMLPFTFIQFLYAPWLEEKNKARAPRSVPDNISGHVILTYFDAVAVNLIEKFNQHGIAYVIVTPELQTALDLHDQGYHVVVGELDDPKTYSRLRIDHAALVVTMNDDIAATNIIYTIREINDGVPTVTNADLDDSLDILKLAGTTHVFQFTRMLGKALSLESRGIEYRVVEKKPGLADKHPGFVQGSAGDRETLMEAGIQNTPSIIITTHDDSLNIYLTIYCRRLRPDAQIISRASLDRNINTLHRAGANLVMSFSSLFTTTIMNLIHPQKMLMLSGGLNVFRMPLNPRLEHRVLMDIGIRENTGYCVVAIKRKEKLITNPDPAIILEPEDELVLIGTADSEKLFTEKYPAGPAQAL